MRGQHMTQKERQAPFLLWTISIPDTLCLLTSILTHQATYFLFHRPDTIHLIHALIHTEFPCWSLPYHPQTCS